MFDSRHISWPITIHIHTQLECGVYTATKVDPFLSFGPRACVVCNALWRVVTCFFASLSNWKRMSSFLDNQKRNKRYNNNNNLPKPPPPPQIIAMDNFSFHFHPQLLRVRVYLAHNIENDQLFEGFFSSFFYLKFRCGSAACNDGVDAKKAVKRRNKKKYIAKQKGRSVISYLSPRQTLVGKAKKKRAIII